MHIPGRHLVCAAVLAALSTAASATTQTVSVTLDTADIVPGLFGFTAGVQDTAKFVGFSPFSLAVDDTLDYTIDFKGSQTLTVSGLSYFWTFVYASTGGRQDASGTGSLQLLDAGGAVLYQSSPRSDTEGSVHFGQTIFASDFPSLPSSITIGGLRYVGTVTAYTPSPADVNNPVESSPVTSRDYNQPAFFYVAQSVPEPSAWLLMAGGLAVVGASATRRRRH